jgi:hypothetical protein
MSAAARRDFTPFSSQLTGSLDQISKMIEENARMHTSLSTGDVSKLQAHAAELQQLTKTLTSILPK